MAPEQFRGRAVDARADVWGIGVTLYECLTAELPFGGGDPFAVMAKVLGRALTRPENARGLDDELWAILLRALAKSPDDRFASASALGHALDAWLARRAHVSAAPTLVSEPPPRSQLAQACSRDAIAAFQGHLDDDALPSLDALIRSKLAGG
jgi:serine/threonine-protein kinase